MRPIVWESEQVDRRGFGQGVMFRVIDAAPSRSHTPCILVVDDEAQIVEFLCQLLEDEGFRAIRAYDGAQAWELIRSCADPPDLVITDVMMPHMTGPQLVQRLTESFNGSSPPVIVMSAVTEVGCQPGLQFLSKPFDIERLLNLVTALTRG